jgi:hypothetical protein
MEGEIERCEIVVAKRYVRAIRWKGKVVGDRKNK